MRVNRSFFLAIAALITFRLLFNPPRLTVAADPAKPSLRWAILIGVDNYINVQRLKYCAADQEALATQLIASGFSKNQVFVLDDKAKEERFHPFIES